MAVAKAPEERRHSVSAGSVYRMVRFYRTHPAFVDVEKGFPSANHHRAAREGTVMESSVEDCDALIRSGARRRTVFQRRLIRAEVATELCGESGFAR